MTTKYILKDVVKELEETSGQKSVKEQKFNLEYIIPNLTEQNILDNGFSFIEYSNGVMYPIYSLGNIEIAVEGIIIYFIDSCQNCQIAENGGNKGIKKGPNTQQN